LAASNELSLEHGFDFQFAARCLGARVPAPVTPYRIARHHDKVWQLREAVDDPVGDSVAQVVDVRVMVRIDEREDSKGLDRFAPRPQQHSSGGEKERQSDENDTEVRQTKTC